MHRKPTDSGTLTECGPHHDEPFMIGLSAYSRKNFTSRWQDTIASFHVATVRVSAFQTAYKPAHALRRESRGRSRGARPTDSPVGRKADRFAMRRRRRGPR